MKILSVDIGTTAMKMGVFEERENDLHLLRQFNREYPINTYNDGLFSDIEQEKWQLAFAAGCKEMSDYMPEIDVIALSGTTPGLTAMDREGNALYPAILMLDQRSRPQAQRIIDIDRYGKTSERDRQYAGGGRQFACQHPVDQRQSA